MDKHLCRCGQSLPGQREQSALARNVLVPMAMPIYHLLMTNVWGQPACIAHCYPYKRMPLTSVWTWILKQPTWAVYFPKAMSKLFAVACAVRPWLTYHVGHTHRGLPAHGSSPELTFEWGRDTHTIWFLFTTVCTRHRLNQRNQVEKWVSGGSGCEDTLPRGSHRHRELDLRII